MHPVATLPGTVSAISAPARDRAQLSWGMVFLMLFTLVVVGRIQEMTPALASLRLGLVTGGLVGFAWLLAPGSLQDKVPLQIKQVRYVLMLLGLAVITIPVAVWPGHSFEAVTGRYWKAVLLFLMVLYWCRSIQDARRMVWICCLGVVGLVVFGIFTGQTADERFHAGSNSYDPNDLALALVMVLPLLLYLFSVSGPGYKFVLAGMAFVCLYGVVLTRSRGGLLGLLALGALILTRSSLSRASKLVVVAISILVFGTPASTVYWDRIQTMWAPKTEYDRTAGGRIEIWKTGLMLMATHPWGVGIDGFTTAEGLSHGGKGKWSAAHNSFLQVGTELGIAGLAIFLLLLARTIKDLRRIQANVPVTANYSNPVMVLASALEVSLWGFVVGGFFLSQAYNGLLYILLALSVACARLAMPLEASEERTGGGGWNKSCEKARYRSCATRWEQS